MGLLRLACCALLLALGASCSDPPEMLQYEKDTERLREEISETRKEVTLKSDELRDLKAKKRAWERSPELDDLRDEVNQLKAKREAAMAELAKAEDEFQAMRSAKLP